MRFRRLQDRRLDLHLLPGVSHILFRKRIHRHGRPLSIALVVTGDPVVLRLRLLYSGTGIVNGRLLRPQRGLFGRQIGFQLVQPCAVAGIVDAEQQFALLH